MCNSAIFLDEGGEFISDAGSIGELMDKGIFVLTIDYPEENTKFVPQDHRLSCLCIVDMPSTACVNGYQIKSDPNFMDWLLTKSVPSDKLSPLTITSNGNAYFNPSQFANATTMINGIEQGIPRVDGPHMVLNNGTEFYFDRSWNLLARITPEGDVDQNPSVRPTRQNRENAA